MNESREWTRHFIPFSPPKFCQWDLSSNFSPTTTQFVRVLSLIAIWWPNPNEYLQLRGGFLSPASMFFLTQAGIEKPKTWRYLMECSLTPMSNHILDPALLRFFTRLEAGEIKYCLAGVYLPCLASGSIFSWISVKVTGWGSPRRGLKILHSNSTSSKKCLCITFLCWGPVKYMYRWTPDQIRDDETGFCLGGWNQNHVRNRGALFYI